MPLRSTGAELKTLAGGLKQVESELKSIGNAFEQSKNKAAKLKQQLNMQLPELHRQRKNISAQKSSSSVSRMTLPGSSNVRINVNGNATSTLSKQRFGKRRNVRNGRSNARNCRCQLRHKKFAS